VQAAPAASLLGPSSQKIGVTLNDPAAGRWIIRVANTSDNVTGTSQRFNGAIEIMRMTSNVGSLDQLSLPDKQAALRALRGGMMTPLGNDFAPYNSATRLQVARALMLGANTRIPQFLPYTPTYSDVSGTNALFVESIAHSPAGDLMNVGGSRFNPNAQADRLTVAIALIKAMGLDSEAQSASAANPGLLDWTGIPVAARGYVSVAVTRGLIVPTVAGYFRPGDAITRLDLAKASVALLQATR